MKKEYYDLYDIVIEQINKNGYFVYGRISKKLIEQKTSLTLEEQKKAIHFFEIMGYFNSNKTFPKIYIRSKKLKGGC